METLNARVGEATPIPEMSPEHRRQFIASMLAELDHAYAKHGARPWSRHEFFGVLREEVDEAWDAIKGDAPIPELLKEVMQIACVCLRYAETPDAYRGVHPLPLPSRVPASSPPAARGEDGLGWETWINSVRSHLKSMTGWVAQFEPGSPAAKALIANGLRDDSMRSDIKIAVLLLRELEELELSEVRARPAPAPAGEVVPRALYDAAWRECCVRRTPCSGTAIYDAMNAHDYARRAAGVTT